jgi:phage terminase large subunit-like protein
MGDAGEGLIDADSRIQERMEELERERVSARTHSRTPEELRVLESLESLKLARRELEGQLAATTHERRRAQIAQALEEIDRRMAAALDPPAGRVKASKKG